MASSTRMAMAMPGNSAFSGETGFLYEDQKDRVRIAVSVECLEERRVDKRRPALFAPTCHRTVTDVANGDHGRLSNLKWRSSEDYTYDLDVSTCSLGKLEPVIGRDKEKISRRI